MIKRTKKPLLEVDVARPVVESFREMGWDVYQEVRDLNTDIIAVLDKRLIHVVEAKTQLNFTVINQAIHRIGIGHWTSICVPEKSCRKNMTIAKIVLSHFGIGLFEVMGNFSHQVIKPRLNRHGGKYTLKYLHEKQKSYAEAGSPGGKAWTPYKDTCEKLLELVKEVPGIMLSDAIKRIDHHYASYNSARQSLALWAQQGKIPGIESQLRNNKICLFPRSN